MLDIKRSYRRLARMHHPDKGGDPSVFRQLNEAYRQLARTEPIGPTTDVTPDADVELPTFLDDTFFASSFESFETVDPPIQLHYVSVSLDEICRGTIIDVKIKRTMVNQRLLRPCQHCNGTGIATITQRLPGSQLGFGKLPKVSCLKCLNGFTNSSILMTTENDNLQCRLPTGCPSGMMFRFPGKGDHLPGMPPSDLVVKIRYQEDGVFSVLCNTLDVQCSLVITLYESLVGFIRTIIHPDGTTHRLSGVSVTKPGRYVIPGDGIHFISEGRRGDLYVDINVEYPAMVNLTGDTLRSILCLGHEFQDGISSLGSSALMSLDHATRVRVDDLLCKNRLTIYRDPAPIPL